MEATVHSKMIMGDRNRRIVGECNGENLDSLRVRYNLRKIYDEEVRDNRLGLK